MAMAVTHETLSASDHSAQLRKAVIASTIGTAIEWYDFFLYGTAAGLIFGKLYFPNQEPLAATLAAFGTYFVGLSTTAGLAETILVNTQRGFDLSWLDGYPKAVKALTREQVNAAIKAHINPAAMVLVEAGSVPAGAK